MSEWTIIIGEEDPATAQELGIDLLGANFRSGGVSTVRFRCRTLADGAQIANYGDPVTIMRDDTAFFQGKIRRIPKSATDEAEVHTYLVEDAWADLERTTYQENWDTHDGLVLTPRVYLGLAENGDEINMGQQITAAVEFIDTLQVGSIPSGLTLWPTEVIGMSCAEVIRTSLRFHPDWIPWIDHTTTPPTFHVTPAASATALTIPSTTYTELDIEEVQDRLPDAVRIVYQTADQFDVASEEDPEDIVTHRVVSIDKYPTDGPDSGPGVLCTVVDLQGARTVVQKQQVQTRPFPTDQTELKAWIKKQYPRFKDIPDAAFQVTVPTRSLVVPDPADVRPPALRRDEDPLLAETLAHVPRQLVSGALPEWIGKRVGQVKIEWRMRATAAATREQRAIIEAMRPDDIVTGTNAVTKIYSSLSNYEKAETAPTGIAQQYFNTITAGARFEGRVSFMADELDTRWYGKKLNISGGHSDWSTMAAPIHSVDWDAKNGTVDLSFGPTPEYAFQDFLEYLRLLNRRTPHWISSDERSAKTIGDEAYTSAFSDSSGPFDAPTSSPVAAVPAVPFKIKVTTTEVDSSPVHKWLVQSYASTIRDGHNGNYYDLTGAEFDTESEFSEDSHLYLEAAVDSSLQLTDFEIVASEDPLDEVEMSGSPLTQSFARLYLGQVTITGGISFAAQATLTAQKAVHGFLNGTIVRVFTAAPAGPDSI